jgi:DNA-binding response OmpR family regulator
VPLGERGRARRVLVVEDDQNFARVMRDNLAFDGFDVEWAADGDAALAALQSRQPDLILLDLMLPKLDGFSLCPLLRRHGRIPIIIVTARGQKADKLRGLELGADDYITKPFDLDEMLARVRAVLRRTYPTIGSLTLGRVILDFRSLSATRDSKRLHLTHREFEVLHYLAERRERIVHRDELLREVWGYALTPTTRSVDLTIARLRKKIEDDPHRPRYIRTAHGNGYCFSVDED